MSLVEITVSWKQNVGSKLLCSGCGWVREFADTARGDQDRHEAKKGHQCEK